MVEEVDICKESKNVFKVKPWVGEDGCIIMDDSLFSPVSEERFEEQDFLKNIYTKGFLPPFFLGFIVSVLVLIPKKILKRHSNVLDRGINFFVHFLKRFVDVLGAVVGLSLSSLVFIFLPILIKLDSSGSVIFKQQRVGRNRRKKGDDRRVISLEVPLERRQSLRRQENLLGMPFHVYKFRSMRQDAELKTGAVWATDNDPRVTGIGKVLRPYHIDEIPQFLNVLKGEMSLVGPRPERPEFIRTLKEEIPNYNQRFTNKPGITGLAQIACGYDTTTDEVNKKLKFDLKYINNFNLLTDLKILWGTARKIITGKEKLDEKDL